MALCARVCCRNWRSIQKLLRSTFLSARFEKRRSAIMSGASSKVSEMLVPASPLSADEFAMLIRAVHFVAARKEIVEENSTSPAAGKKCGESDIGEQRVAIADITNVEKPRSPAKKDVEKNELKSAHGIDEGGFTKLVDREKEDEATPKTPFQRFRGKYLTVTDFAGQLWCEQQLDYKFDPPPGVVITEKPQMAKGTDLHLARELEIQEIVEVEVTSREDAFALKLLNLIACLRDLLSGVQTVRREIPIFGAPFNLDLFVVGIIDEVRFDSRSRKVDVVELKTRLTAKLPSRAQKRTHDLQVMLYRRMWNDLVSGQLAKNDIVKHMQLVPDTRLGDEVCTQLRNLSIMENAASVTLDSLLDQFFVEMASMPSAAQLFVEYCHQETKERFAVESVGYDETWLRQQLEHAASYWRGERSPRGVDIEEAWKCKFCDFADVCAWRLRKQEECADRNRQNFADATVVLRHPTVK